MKTMLYALCFVCCIAVVHSASTAEIETLRLRAQDSNAELTASEKGVITKFWSASLDQMLLSDSFDECIEIRNQLIEQKGSDHLSYYSTAYVAEANNAIGTAFRDIQRMENAQQRKMIERNLIILTAELESPDLASLALQKLGSQDAVVRYWAYKAVTAPAVIQQLTSDVTGDEKTIQAILSEFKKRITGETQVEIQKMVIRLCRMIDDPLARDVLLLIADQRVTAYQDWTVTDETLEVNLLTALGHIAVTQQDPAKKTFGHKFAELYAMVFQRYLKGEEVFSKDQVESLLTVIAEVDRNVLAKTMGINTQILPALKSKRGLDREYEALFGDRTRPGQLATKFNFDYGKDGSGKTLTSPPEIGPMPEKLTEQK